MIHLHLFQEALAAKNAETEYLANHVKAQNEGLAEYEKAKQEAAKAASVQTSMDAKSHAAINRSKQEWKKVDWNNVLTELKD